MSFDGQLPIYVINLARSKDRWQAIEQSALAHDLSLTRVDAVDGRDIASQQWQDFDPAEFGRRNGRSALPGEYGCYMSHLHAIEAFVQSGLPAGVILEDDVELVADFDTKVRAILACLPPNSLVKLVHYRLGGFVQVADVSGEIRVGACAFGPEGSSAAYALTRSAAVTLLKALKPMSLPYDVALGRGWANGVRVYNLAVNLLPMFQGGHSASTIVVGTGYGGAKWKKWRRIPAYLFRISEHLRRIIHAFQCRLFPARLKDAL
jgi:glycosyl transferase, family 25